MNPRLAQDEPSVFPERVSVERSAARRGHFEINLRQSMRSARDTMIPSGPRT
jgi:hypothetical protein